MKTAPTVVWAAALLLVCVFSARIAAQEPQFEPQTEQLLRQSCEAEEGQCSGDQSVAGAQEDWFTVMRRSFAEAATAVATTLLPIRNLNYSPMNVHPTTSSPSFRGWFMRLTDHKQRTTVVVLVGAFTADHTRPDDNQYYLFVAIDSDGEVGSNNDRIVWNVTAFPAADDVEMYSEDPNARICNVYWRSTTYGTVQIYNDTAFADLRFGDNHIEARMTSRVPYSIKSDLAGPEGWLTHSSLLPSRYFVHSIGSRGSYRATLADRKATLEGNALVHLETNYGRAFPTSWTWLQACAPGPTTMAAGIVGGEMPVGPLEPMLWGVMVVWGGQRLEYRTTDFDLVHYSFDSASKSLELFAMPPPGRRNELVHVTAHAPPESFGDPMYIPTVHGFTDNPGCVESYHSTVRVRVYRKLWFYRPANDEGAVDFEALRTSDSSMFADDAASSRELYRGPSSSWTQRLLGVGGPASGSIKTHSSSGDMAEQLETVATEGWVLVGDQVMENAAFEFGGGFQTRRGKSQEYEHFLVKWADTAKYDLARDFQWIKWRPQQPGYVEEFEEPRLLLIRDPQQRR